MQSEAAYGAVVARLRARVGVAPGASCDGVAVARDIATRVRQGMIGWPTAKQYASAMRWALRREGRPTVPFDAIWTALRGTAFRLKRRRPSSRRTKITPALIDALAGLAACRDERSRAPAALALFRAGVLLGLRPCEWADASWADAGRTRLVVRNAKAARTVMEHGPFAGRLWVRANGSERTLVLSDRAVDAPAARELRDLVDEVLANERARPWARHRNATWRTFKTLVRDAHARGLIGAKHRHLTLYSSRHQFAADAKRWLSVRDGEVAAAMGHVSVGTAVRSYGRRLAGGSVRPLVTPDAASVLAVRSVALRTARAGPLPRSPASGAGPGSR